MNGITCDILIVGTGLAGLYAAWRTSEDQKVVIISKASDPFANSWHAQGGIAAAIGRDDSPATHYDDTLKAGSGLSDPDAAIILVEEGKNLMQNMLDCGLRVDTQNGTPSLGLEGGHSRRRILHLDGDLSGRRTMEFLQENIQSKKNITAIPESEVIELITFEGRCTGAIIYHHDKDEVSYVGAGATLLATGGLSALYPRSTNPKYSIGDGVALAYEAGAALQDMEFIQFHPTAFCQPGERAFLISEAVRGEGAKLINNAGDPFLKKTGELDTRDVVARGIYKELQRSGEENVNLDLRHLDHSHIQQRFHSIYNYLANKGIHMTRDLIPVSPAAHYMIGGVKTDLSGRTTMPGLFAAGEVASTGVMGANRLASNSLLECIVFADRAIQTIHSEKTGIPLPYNEDYPFSYNSGEREKYQKLRKKVGKILNKHAGIIRNGKSLRKGISKITALKEHYSFQPDTYYFTKAEHAINNAMVILESALARSESRGVHYRSDCPISTTAFLAHSEIIYGNPVSFKRI
ncbi:MAG: L-aspartate oxidase [Marinilabiliales bacterium]|nr:MAG: L-aspartate oxidase [Marinilabiliales bacterium]